MEPVAPQQRWDRSRPAHTIPEIDADWHPLPVDAQIVPVADGWEVRVPLRAEQVAIAKQTMVAEQVTIRRNQVTEVVRVGDTVARETLTVEPSDELERVPDGDREVFRGRPPE